MSRDLRKKYQSIDVTLESFTSHVCCLTILKSENLTEKMRYINLYKVNNIVVPRENFVAFFLHKALG